MTTPKSTSPAKKPTVLTRNVVAIAPPIKHPAPPANLTAGQAQVWSDTLLALDPTWFRPDRIPDGVRDAVFMMNGAIIARFTQGGDYWLGSSRGSGEKQGIIDRLNQRG